PMFREVQRQLKLFRWIVWSYQILHGLGVTVRCSPRKIKQWCRKTRIAIGSKPQLSEGLIVLFLTIKEISQLPMRLRKRWRQSHRFLDRGKCTVPIVQAIFSHTEVEPFIIMMRAKTDRFA